MTVLFYIGLVIMLTGFVLILVGEVKADFVLAQLGGLSLLCGLFLTVLVGPSGEEKPSVKVGQVWLIGDEDPFKCDTVRVMRISHGHVKYVGLKELRTEEMMAELDSLLDANGTLLYSADYSSCSIEKFVIDGRRVK